MSNNFDNDPIRYGNASNAAVDAGLRTFFRSVYNYMIAGLAVTGIVGFVVAYFAFQDGSVLGQILYGSPVRWVVMLAPLGLSLIFGGRIYTMKPSSATGRVLGVFRAHGCVAVIRSWPLPIGSVGAQQLRERHRLSPVPWC